jgi:acetylornithine deacetylase/succinyl-diaminopimelate desuccinylase-like protein
MTRVEKLLCELIALPSVNPAFLPARHPHVGEHRVADFIAARCARDGLDVAFQNVSGNRRNILCRLLPHRAARHRILLAPHLDTVNLSGDSQLIPTMRNRRIHGRGACDTKGSVATMLTALSELARTGRRPQHTEILFVGFVDEENAQAGSRAFTAAGLPADLAIVGEPTDSRVVTAHKGNLWLRLETRGRSAHGATPQHGRNAILEMTNVVQALETRYRAQLNRRRHPLLGSPTVSVGTIRGGSQANIVPDQCAIEVDRRTLPGETERSVRSELSALLRSIRCRAAVRTAKSVACPPLETTDDAPFVRELLRAARQRGGKGVHFFCDAAVLAGGGIPSVVFGPGNIAQAHTSDEWVSLTQLERARSVLVRFLRSLP